MQQSKAASVEQKGGYLIFVESQQTQSAEQLQRGDGKVDDLQSGAAFPVGVACGQGLQQGGKQAG